MGLWLFGGMDLGPLHLSRTSALFQDILLILQFPLLHSLFLGKWGRRHLERAFPGELGRTMVSTTFVVLASLQLIVLFVAWAPIGGFRWQPTGLLLQAWSAWYIFSWILLAVAMWNAGLSTQMGYLGWWSVWRGKPVQYGDFPTHGLYRVCRHPVYFAMALVALSGPVWTIDHAVVAAVFCAYCIAGPMLKDRRYQRRFGKRFETYKRAVPFFPMPSLFNIFRSN
jgi:protein-S-isoprenylcysteine O-methyltransferase Ste14